MKVKVKLMSIFSQYSKSDKDGNTSVKDSGTVMDLIKELGLPAEQVRILTVNGRQSDLNTVLSEGDTIFIFPPAMGGG